jgi:hypothetical protein
MWEAFLLQLYFLVSVSHVAGIIDDMASVPSCCDRHFQSVQAVEDVGQRCRSFRRHAHANVLPNLVGEDLPSRSGSSIRTRPQGHRPVDVVRLIRRQQLESSGVVRGGGRV